MATLQVHRIALIGAGPRGTSVLERLIAHMAAQPQDGTRLEVHVIDPFPPGPGHVWRLEQSRLYLMNTPALFPTVMPGTSWPVRSPLGLSFDDWRQLMLLQGTTGPADTAGTTGPADAGRPDPEDTAELRALGRADFPSRAVYGRYLSWVFAQLLGFANERLAITVHRAEAVRLTPAGPRWELELSDADTLSVDGAVLALGHLPAQLRDEQQEFVEAAAAHGIRYWPPNIPADVNWAKIPGGEPVLVRGLGLNFFDLMSQLTEGRGGRFTASGRGPGAALRYECSGAEPLIFAASRRGTPYRAKAKLDSYIPAGVRLRFCTDARLAAFAAQGVRPGFNHDFWPLLHRDVLWTYYTVLARAVPKAFTGTNAAAEHGREFLVRLDLLLRAREEDAPEPWETRVEQLVAKSVTAGHRLRLPRLARPFEGENFAAPADFDAAVVRYLHDDAAGSDAGEADPLKMAIGALNAGRSVIKKAVADDGLTDASWLGELRGWFEPFVEGLASGPPALRIEQLAALARAGVVHFLGPDPKFRVHSGVGLFEAFSPWVDGPPVRAAAMVEAMMPANRVSRNISPLLSGLLAEGLVRPRMMLSADDTPVITSGLDMSASPYRPLDAQGRARTGLYALGLQLSSVQWGTAISAEAGADAEAGARTLKDADDIARDILDRAAARDAAAGGTAARDAVAAAATAGQPA